MTGPTHVSFGFCLGVLLCTAFGINFAQPYHLIGLFLGSLAPDIDAEGALVSQVLVGFLGQFLAGNFQSL